MKYIKLFDEHTNYETYITGNNKLLPNLSFCEDIRDLHLNRFIDPRIICKFNVTPGTNTISIMNSGSSSFFNEIEIDGVVLSNVVTSYTFDTEGIHTVKYTLKNNTTITNGAFQYCTELISVTIPNSVTSIANSAFYNCTNLTNINLPNSITSITNGAFKNCTSLVNINLPNSLIRIGSAAFDGCSALASLTIPNSVIYIENTAFQNCGHINPEIIIPSSVTSIGDKAFYYCNALFRVIMESATPPTLGTEVFEYMQAVIYVPDESVNTYKTATNWSSYVARIKAISEL